MSTSLEQQLGNRDPSLATSDWTPYMSVAEEALVFWERQGFDFRAFDETAESREALIGRVARTLRINDVDEALRLTRNDAERVLSQMLSSFGREPLLPPESQV